MSYLGNTLNFEWFNGKQMLRDAWRNPDQILLGAADPFGAKLWSGITGKDYKPIVDQMGGATDQRYKQAEEKGIDTKNARQMQDAAHVIAALFAADYGAGAAGAGSGAGAGAGAGGGAAAGAGGGAAAGAGAGGAGAGSALGGAQAAPAAAGGSSWLQTAGQGMGAASQAKGLLSSPQQPIQQGQVGGRQGPDFSGLLAAQTQQDAQIQQEQLMRKQQQQQIMQGLLGAQYGR